jgi:hypothetical protein
MTANPDHHRRAPVADNQILLGLLQLRNKYERPLATTQRAARAV